MCIIFVKPEKLLWTTNFPEISFFVKMKKQKQAMLRKLCMSVEEQK